MKVECIIRYLHVVVADVPGHILRCSCIAHVPPVHMVICCALSGALSFFYVLFLFLVPVSIHFFCSDLFVIHDFTIGWS